MTLPVDELIPDIREFLRTGRCLILQAAPGTGKTTRVPPALLEVMRRRILVLEPRRLAARLSAERVAQEMGEACGKTAGFQIRYERMFGPDTRVKFITEGVFLRLLLADPALSDVDCVVLDEFHERHIHTDVALALVRHLQNTLRPDLKLVIMSATLEAAPLQSYLPEARVFQAEGRMFPVEIQFQSHPERGPVDQAAVSAVAQLYGKQGISGHTLVFLPGAAEIRRAAEGLAETARQHDCLLLELRSETPADQQQRVFEPSARPKIILATNVAETSITIDGITAVVDCGLAKLPGHDPWSGLPSLETKPVSQSSCIQRAGRAGRTGPGTALRLYTRHDYLNRPAAEKPEIQRLDLTQILLELQVASERFPESARFKASTLPWFDAPPPGMVQGCIELLRLLGAVDSSGTLSDTGRAMAAYPLHPRLSRVIAEGRALKSAPQAALAAALLNEGMILKRGVDAAQVTHSDVSRQIDLLRAFLRGDRRSAEQVDPGAAKRVERLARWLAETTGTEFKEMLKPLADETLAQALLTGFPERVARVRKRGAGQSDRIELALCTGVTAVLSRSSSIRDSEWMLALEAEESRGHREASSFTQIRTACEVDKEMLLSGPEEFLREEDTFYWDDAAARARGVRRLRYGTLALEETPLPGNDPRHAEVLCRTLREKWPRPFEDAGPLESLRRRASLLNENGFHVQIPDLAGEAFDSLLKHISEDRKSFAEVKERDLRDYIEDLIPQKDLRALRDNAPENIPVGRRRIHVNYEAGKPPWIASALQDFFGLRSTPRIAAGRVPLVIHLLAPNKRPVQVTQDLESFWLRHYPDLRKALSRRYPKHSWPEDPLRASPPDKRK